MRCGERGRRGGLISEGCVYAMYECVVCVCVYVGTMYCDSRSNRNKRRRGSWDLDAIGQMSGSQET